MPVNLDALKNRLTSALADRRVTASEAEGLLDAARADGLAPEETALLRQAMEANKDAFEPAAADAMRKALSLDGGHRDLADPAVLKKHLGQVDYTHADGQLFVDGAQAEDVIQGQIADCYMVSSFAAVAHTHPEVIEKAIRDNGDGTFTVRLYQTSYYGQPKPVDVTVDGDLPEKYGRMEYAKGADRKELWVPLLEKAFAQWKGGYDAIGNGGSPSMVMGALLGRTGSYQNLSEGMDGQALFSQLKGAFDQGKAVVAATHGEDQSALYTGTGLYAWHAYTVLGVSEENGKQYVELRNPWGESEPSGNGADDGIFKLDMATFSKMYASVYVN